MRMRCLVACLFSLLLAAAPVPSAAQTVLDQETNEGYISINDSLELHFQTVGSGRDTVVVLHGGPGLHLNTLRADLAPLALSRTLLFYDQRGGGESTLVEDAAYLTWQHHVADLETLRRHFGMGRLKLIGHSWGGLLAALYAKEHPEHVDRMVFIDAGPPPAREPYFDPPNPTPRLDSLSRAKMLSARQQWSAAPDSTKQCWNFYSQFGEGFTSDPAYAHQTWSDMCDAPPAAMFNGNAGPVIASLGPDYDFMDEFARIEAPTLLVHGEDDLIPVGVAQQWDESLPNAHLVIVEEAGHFPHFEQPAVFFPLVDAFLVHPTPTTFEPTASRTWPPDPAAAEGAYERAWWEISAAHDRLEAAIAAQDAMQAVEAYTEDALLLVPTAPPIEGHRQIRAFFQDTFNKGVRRAEFQTLDLEGDDTQLVEGGRYTLRDEEGKVLDMGKYLVVWKKVGERWRAHRDMFNTSMEVPSSLYEYDLGG